MLVKFLKYLSFGFLGGVIIHSIFFNKPISLVYVLVLLGLGISLFIFFHRKRKMIFVGLFLVGCVFGLLRFGAQMGEQSAEILDIFAYEKESISLHGKIISDPVEYISYTEFILATDYLLIHESQTFPVQTQILVRTDNYTEYEYGHIVMITGVPEKPGIFETESKRMFDYQSYLAKDQIYYTMRFADTEIYDKGDPSIRRSLYRFKNFFLGHIYKIIPEPESGLLAGVLFGEKSGLDDDWEDKFRIVGLMHIVVLSGYNVSLVIQLFLKVLIFLPLRVRSLLAILGIIGFALLVGAGPTVIRASIMALFIVLAEMISVRYDITRALYIAGIIMVIINPMILYFDISFQLSFLATYGLVVLTPWLNKKFSFLPKIFAIKESAVATIAAQIMVLPILIYHIGELSIISPIVNVLVLFAVPYSMLFGFLSALLSSISMIIGSFLGVITTYLLKYQLWIVDVFAHIPFASIALPKIHWIFVCMMYGLIFWWIRRIKTSLDTKR